jgi:hypothetical protein
VPRRREDLVGVRKREDLLQIRSLELLDAALVYICQLQSPLNGLKYKEMPTFLHDYMSRVLSVQHLYSENRTIAARNECNPSSVISHFLECYESVFPERNAADSASHDQLALCLEKTVEDMQKITYAEAFAAPEDKLGRNIIGRFNSIFSILVKYGKSVHVMAIHLVPILVHCLHPCRELSMEFRQTLSFFHEICHMEASEQDVADIQGLIVTNLTTKWENKTAFDVLLATQTTYLTAASRQSQIQQVNYNLFTCIRTFFRNPLHRNALCRTELQHTRLFDILVLSLLHCTRQQAGIPSGGFKGNVTLQVLLELLERNPCQRGCGFIFLTVQTQGLGAASGSPVQTEEFCTELPGVDCTSTTLSTGMLEEMCMRLVNTDKRHIISYEYKIGNIATGILDSMQAPELDSAHGEVCFKILSLLTETHDEIRPEIGLEWTMSHTEPPCMQAVDCISANYSLGEALQQNPMLAEALVNGRLHFTAADWQDMSARQSLFVPVNSLVYQRGLSGRGIVKIGSVYFQAVARGSMQGLLGCHSVSIVSRQMLSVASRVIRTTASGDIVAIEDKTIDTTEHGVLFRSLLFLESMLDQIMDIDGSQRFNVVFAQQTLIESLARVLRREGLGTTLYQITCHIIDQFMRKLDIPVYDEIPRDSQALITTLEQGTIVMGGYSAHENYLYRTNEVLFTVLECGVHRCLFRLLQSSPQATEEECLICFYACAALVDIYKIRARKYSREVREITVDAALVVTEKNIRNNTGFLTTALLEQIMKLQACCEEGSTPSFVRRVARRWLPKRMRALEFARDSLISIQDFMVAVEPLPQ